MQRGVDLKGLLDVISPITAHEAGDRTGFDSKRITEWHRGPGDSNGGRGAGRAKLRLFLERFEKSFEAYPSTVSRLDEFCRSRGYPPQKVEPPASTLAESESPSAKEPSPADPPEPSWLQVVLDYIEHDIALHMVKQATQQVLGYPKPDSTGDPTLKRFSQPQAGWTPLDWNRSSRNRATAFREILGAAEASRGLHRPEQVRAAVQKLDGQRVDQLLKALDELHPTLLPGVPPADSDWFSTIWWSGWGWPNGWPPVGAGADG